MRQVVVKTQSGKFTQAIEIGSHRLLGDEPQEVGGNDQGPSPFEYLLTSLGCCTSMTMKMYADRKNWPLEKVSVSLSLEKTEQTTLIRRSIQFSGNLDEVQTNRLLDIANKCPVHRTLTGIIEIQSEIVRI